MAGFLDKDRIRKMWDSLRQPFRRVRSQEQTENSKIEPEGVTVRRMSRKKPLIVAGGALLVLAAAGFGGSQYVKANTIDFVEVYKDGALIGEVGSERQVAELIDSKRTELQTSNPNVNMVLDTGTLTYGHKSAYKAEPDSEATLHKLEGMFSSHATGVELKIDGKLVGIVKDQATADDLLNRIESQYTKQTTAKDKKTEVTALAYEPKDSNLADKSAATPTTELKSVKFVEDVATDGVDVDPKRIGNPDELFEKITKGTVKPTKYTVQEGDCVSCIAAKFDISAQLIYERNPQIKNDMIKVGEELDLTVLKPEVTVETVETVTEQEAIAPATEIQKNDQMRAGESKVIRQGTNGKKLVTYKLVKQNGYLMSEDLVSEQVLVKAIPTIVMKGTKVVLGEGTGNFMWPVTGHRITSSFGKRWGTLHMGIDMVGDKKIMAADNGVVTFSGVKSGYGNCIIINHKNGYETVYGHMSKLIAKKGDIVEKGEQIGVMGSTGHSTGTHLHFEIHKNGDLQNPINYL